MLNKENMPGPMSSDKNIISKGPGNDPKRAHVPSPRGKQKSEHGHAEGASLGDAAGMRVGLPKTASDCFVVSASSMKSCISIAHLNGAATQPEQLT